MGRYMHIFFSQINSFGQHLILDNIFFAIDSFCKKNHYYIIAVNKKISEKNVDFQFLF